MNTNSSLPLTAHEHHHDRRNRFIIGAGIIIVLAVVIGGIFIIHAKRQKAFNEYYDAVMAAERESAFKALSESDAKPLSDADRAKVFEVLVNAGGEGLSDADRAQAFADLEAGEKLRRQEIKQQYKDLP